MEINGDLIWVTPDPTRVKRLIALKRNGRWIETYLGERILVHKSNLPLLENKGFMVCQDSFDKFVYDTPEEAEQSNMSLITSENQLQFYQR